MVSRIGIGRERSRPAAEVPLKASCDLFRRPWPAAGSRPACRALLVRSTGGADCRFANSSSSDDWCCRSLGHTKPKRTRSNRTPTVEVRLNEYHCAERPLGIRPIVGLRRKSCLHRPGEFLDRGAHGEVSVSEMNRIVIVPSIESFVAARV